MHTVLIDSNLTYGTEFDFYLGLKLGSHLGLRLGLGVSWWHLDPACLYSVFYHFYFVCWIVFVATTS